MNTELASVIGDNAIAYTQTQPASTRSALGGEERIENLGHDFTRDAAAVIRHNDPYLVPGGQGFNDDVDFAAGGLHRVFDQIDDHFLNIFRVHQDR